MKSLLDLIQDTLDKNPEMKHLAPKAERIIKDEAKRYFFDGKINAFVTYIFGELNPEIEQNFTLKLNQIGIDSKIFLPIMIKNIQKEVANNNHTKDLNGLLQLLGYDHLKPFISLFK